MELSHQHVNSEVELSVATATGSSVKAPRLFVALFDYDPKSLCTTGHPEEELTLHTGWYTVATCV